MFANNHADRHDFVPSSNHSHSHHGDRNSVAPHVTEGTGITELVLIVDASGSMAGLESDTIGGINATLAHNRTAGGRCNVSLVQFNNCSDVVLDRKPIERVRDLTPRDYRVGGCTALLDAVGGAIRHTALIQRNLPAEYRAEHVIFCIITDGLENASRQFSHKQVKHLIEKNTASGWEFIFMGANIDVAAEADRLGIRRDRVAEWANDSVGTGLAYEDMADAVCCMRANATVDASWGQRSNAYAQSRRD